MEVMASKVRGIGWRSFGGRPMDLETFEGMFTPRIEGPAFKSPPTARHGDAVTVQVQVYGIPAPDVRWLVGKQEIKDCKEFRLKDNGTNYTLHITKATEDLAERGITVVARNRLGEARRKVDFKVYKVLASRQWVIKENYESDKAPEAVVVKLRRSVRLAAGESVGSLDSVTSDTEDFTYEVPNNRRSYLNSSNDSLLEDVFIQAGPTHKRSITPVKYGTKRDSGFMDSSHYDRSNMHSHVGSPYHSLPGHYKLSPGENDYATIPGYKSNRSTDGSTSTLNSKKKSEYNGNVRHPDPDEIDMLYAEVRSGRKTPDKTFRRLPPDAYDRRYEASKGKGENGRYGTLESGYSTDSANRHGQNKYATAPGRGRPHSAMEQRHPGGSPYNRRPFHSSMTGFYTAPNNRSPGNRASTVDDVYTQVKSAPIVTCDEFQHNSDLDTSSSGTPNTSPQKVWNSSPAKKQPPFGGVKLPMPPSPSFRKGDQSQPQYSPFNNRRSTPDSGASDAGSDRSGSSKQVRFDVKNRSGSPSKKNIEVIVTGTLIDKPKQAQPSTLEPKPSDEDLTAMRILSPNEDKSDKDVMIEIKRNPNASKERFEHTTSKRVSEITFSGKLKPKVVQETNIDDLETNWMEEVRTVFPTTQPPKKPERSKDLSQEVPTDNSNGESSDFSPSKFTDTSSPIAGMHDYPGTFTSPSTDRSPLPNGHHNRFSSGEGQPNNLKDQYNTVLQSPTKRAGVIPVFDGQKAFPPQKGVHRKPSYKEQERAGDVERSPSPKHESESLPELPTTMLPVNKGIIRMEYKQQNFRTTSVERVSPAPDRTLIPERAASPIEIASEAPQPFPTNKAIKQSPIHKSTPPDNLQSKSPEPEELVYVLEETYFTTPNRDKLIYMPTSRKDDPTRKQKPKTQKPDDSKDIVYLQEKSVIEQTGVVYMPLVPTAIRGVQETSTRVKSSRKTSSTQTTPPQSPSISDIRQRVISSESSSEQSIVNTVTSIVTGTVSNMQLSLLPPETRDTGTSMPIDRAMQTSPSAEDQPDESRSIVPVRSPASSGVIIGDNGREEHLLCRREADKTFAALSKTRSHDGYREKCNIETIKTVEETTYYHDLSSIEQAIEEKVREAIQRAARDGTLPMLTNFEAVDAANIDPEMLQQGGLMVILLAVALMQLFGAWTSRDTTTDDTEQPPGAGLP